MPGLAALHAHGGESFARALLQQPFDGRYLEAGTSLAFGDLSESLLLKLGGHTALAQLWSAATWVLDDYGAGIATLGAERAEHCRVGSSQMRLSLLWEMEHRGEQLANPAWAQQLLSGAQAHALEEVLEAQQLAAALAAAAALPPPPSQEALNLELLLHQPLGHHSGVIGQLREAWRDGGYRSLSDLFRRHLTFTTTTRSGTTTTTSRSAAVVSARTLEVLERCKLAEEELARTLWAGTQQLQLAAQRLLWWRSHLLSSVEQQLQLAARRLLWWRYHLLASVEQDEAINRERAEATTAAGGAPSRCPNIGGAGVLLRMAACSSDPAQWATLLRLLANTDMASMSLPFSDDGPAAAQQERPSTTITPGEVEPLLLELFACTQWGRLLRELPPSLLQQEGVAPAAVNARKRERYALAMQEARLEGEAPGAWLPARIKAALYLADKLLCSSRGGECV